MRVPTILVTGPVGVGKTTLIDEMGMILADAGLAHATIDLDQLRAMYPRAGAGEDKWGTKVGLANLKAVWRNYRRAGARRLLIATVIESKREVARYREAVPGGEITVVRLRARVRTLQTRVRRRGSGDVKWHVARAAELAPLMDRRRVEDLVVETEGRTPQSVAVEVLVKVGWIKERPPLRR